MTTPLDFLFFFNNIMLGVGLAMDAFSVSLANGMNEPRMCVRKTCLIAGVFAIFQALMPLAGWFCVHTLLAYFQIFEPFIPWIALALLGFIGGKMLWEGITCKPSEKKDEPCSCTARLGIGALLLQGVATSIDALSVGFTIAEYDAFAAVLAALLIALVTFIICLMGVLIGRKLGNFIAGKAGILGGIILIIIGLNIFITGVF
ncbi:MAG: manganese efflux pump [Ruminococcaceae bacterium]|nr:manganese efflux pump [Oscillospiraceae bacterium]